MAPRKTTDTIHRSDAVHRVATMKRQKMVLQKAGVQQSSETGSVEESLQRHISYMVWDPTVGSTVSSPFDVTGTFDKPGVPAVVFLMSNTTYDFFGPTEVVDPPPAGMDWAFRFEVPGGDNYTLYDIEGSTTYAISPIHVS